MEISGCAQRTCSWATSSNTSKTRRCLYFLCTYSIHRSDTKRLLQQLIVFKIQPAAPAQKGGEGGEASGADANSCMHARKKSLRRKTSGTSIKLSDGQLRRASFRIITYAGNYHENLREVSSVLPTSAWLTLLGRVLLAALRQGGLRCCPTRLY